MHGKVLMLEANQTGLLLLCRNGTVFFCSKQAALFAVNHTYGHHVDTLLLLPCLANTCVLCAPLLSSNCWSHRQATWLLSKSQVLE